MQKKKKWKMASIKDRWVKCHNADIVASELTAILLSSAVVSAQGFDTG